MKKGQVTIEFATISVFMLFLFATLFLALQGRVHAMRDTQSLEVMAQLANVVTSEVKLAAKVGEGYRREFILPATLNGEDYIATIQDQLDLSVTFEHLEYVAFLETNVIGNIQKGSNAITNTGGLIRLNV